MRALLHQQFEKEKIKRKLAVTLLICFCLVVLRGIISIPYVSGEAKKLTMDHYYNALVRGQSYYAPQPVTLEHIFIALREAYKASIYFFIANELLFKEFSIP